MQAFEVRDYEIERRLDLFARARLTPDPQAKARARARVMREARLQFEAAQTAVHAVAADTTRSARSPVRRVAVPLLAAAVWIVIAVGSISAAQAGGPLYQTRIWLEDVTLPGDGGSRITAELGRLDARLGEAMAAAARGDAAAVQAALDAYRAIADEAVADASTDDSLEARVAIALDQHRLILTAVADRLDGAGHDDAAAAVELSIARTISHNQATIDRIGAASTGAGGDPSHPSAGGGTSGPDSTTGGGEPPAGGAKPSAAPGAGGAGAGGGAAGGVDSHPNPSTPPAVDKTPPGGPDEGTGNDHGGHAPKPVPSPIATPDRTQGGGGGGADGHARGDN